MAKDIDVRVLIDAVDNASKRVSDVEDSLKKLTKSTGDLEKGYATAEKASKSWLDRTKDMTLSFISANVIMGAFNKTVSIVKESIGGSIEAFKEQEQAIKQTEAVLKSTAGVAGMTKDEVVSLSEALQAQTTFADEDILSAENLLLTFTSIGKQTFPEATKAVLDMSQALGQDLKSSSIQLGKALQDPILGVTALRRVGVNFSEENQNFIKSLVESGKTLEAQKFILKEINTEFGGSAEKAAEGTGKFKQLANAVDDLKESFGEILVNAMSPFASELSNIVTSDQAKEFFKDLDQSIRDILTQDNLKLIIEDIKGVGAALGNAGEGILRFSEDVGSANIILDGIKTSLRILATLFVGLGESIDLVVTMADQFVLSCQKSVLAIELVIAYVTGSQNAYRDLLGQITVLEQQGTQRLIDFGARTKENADIMNQIWSDHILKVQEVEPAYMSVNTVATNAMNNMSVNVGQAHSNITISAESLTRQMKDKVVGNYTTMQGQAVTAVNTMSTQNVTTVAGLKTSVENTTSLMSKNTTKSFDELNSNAQKSMADLHEKTVSSAQTTHNDLKSWFDKIVGFFNTIISKASEALSKSREAATTDWSQYSSRRQYGGPVGAATEYMVGEVGPEKYTPQTAGYITPHGEYSSTRESGGGTTINFIIQSDMIINSPNERRGIAEAIYKDLVDLARAQNMSVAEYFAEK